MANNVFANGREISCKKADGKSICAFPDVCMTPPENPATPPGVPVPYPNTGMAKDTTSGSKEVKISGNEVMLKNKSYFKKSIGDEAGCAAKKGVVTSVNRGKVYFNAWSMDVKVEGENVVRHLDITTHNHGSGPNSPPQAHIDTQAFSVPPECKEMMDRVEDECVTNGGSAVSNDRVVSCTEECRAAQKCILPPKSLDKSWCCPEEPDNTNTGHHMIEDQWVKDNPGFPDYDYDAAPTVCANTYRNVGSVHRELHDIQGVYVESYQPNGPRCDPSKPSNGFDYQAGKKAALNAHSAVFDSSNCDWDCLEKQLDDFYGDDPDRSLNLPDRRQDLKDQREITLEDYGWGSVLGH